MSPAPALDLEASFRTSRIIHVALIGSLLLYAVMAHVLVATGWQPQGLPGLAVVRWLLLAVAVAAAAAVLVLRSRWLTVDAAAELGRRAGATAFTQLQTRLVILLALAESIGVFGLVLFVLSGSFPDLYTLCAVGVLLQLALTPRREVWDAAGRAMRGAPR